MNPRSVLVLANDFPDEHDERPAGIFIKEQVRALARTGLPQIVIIPYPTGLERYRRTRYHDYETAEGVPIRFLRYPNPLFPLQWHAWKHGWVSVEARAVAAFLHKHGLRPPLVQAHYTWPTGAVAAELARHRRVPLVITEHAHTTIDPFISRSDPILKRAWMTADAVVRVSSADVDRYAAIAGRRKIHVIHNGHDETLMRSMDRYEARRALGLCPERRLLFSLGGLYQYKGHRYLVESMREVTENNSEVDLLIGGDGPQRANLDGQIEKLGLKGRVRLVGSLSHSEVPLWMAACDVFVLPSVVESFGIVQVEALACGRPVVATYNRASQDIITHESYGLLCPPEDVAGLSVCLLDALGRTWEERVLVERAKDFTWTTNAESYRDLYRSLLKRMPPQ